MANTLSTVYKTFSNLSALVTLIAAHLFAVPQVFIAAAAAFSRHPLISLLKSQMGQFYSTDICFTFIYSIHIEMCTSSFPPQHPLIHPHSVSSGLLPQGLMGYEYSLGLLFSQPVREALEREGERTGERRRQRFSVCLMSL